MVNFSTLKQRFQNHFTLMDKQESIPPEAKTTENDKKLRSFKIQLGEFNEIINYAMKVLNYWPPATDLLPEESISNPQIFPESTQWLFPPKRTISSSAFRNKVVAKGIEMKSQLLPICEQSTKLTNHTKKSSNSLKLAKFNDIKQVQIHFSLQRLAILVKMYMQKHGSALVQSIYIHIIGKCTQSMGLTKAQAEQLFSNVRRRICQVLRVLGGVGAVQIERKTAVLTELGKLKGRGLVKHSRSRRQMLQKKRRELERLKERRKQLQYKLQAFENLKKRNKEISLFEETNMVHFGQVGGRIFHLPLTFIGGKPRPITGLFRTLATNDFHSVDVNSSVGSIIIKGENLRVIQFEEVVHFLGGSASK